MCVACQVLLLARLLDTNIWQQFGLCKLFKHYFHFLC